MGFEVLGLNFLIVLLTRISPIRFHVTHHNPGATIETRMEIQSGADLIRQDLSQLKKDMNDLHMSFSDIGKHIGETEKELIDQIKALRTQINDQRKEINSLSAIVSNPQTPGSRQANEQVREGLQQIHQSTQGFQKNLETSVEINQDLAKNQLELAKRVKSIEKVMLQVYNHGELKFPADRRDSAPPRL
ncbi:MAG: hypothetical protein CBD40_03970 [Gammaproteobacteria bacterium TMED180]|nr:MAG: hypothetical protein CBD40_03970 [Gammaproteobacteria bacterium TMED180]